VTFSGLKRLIYK